MFRTRPAIRRHSLGHASCAVQLLAGAGLLTLMPSVMAESPFAQALQYAQPLSWVMLAAGAGVLLAQWWLGGKRAPSVGIAGTGSDRRPPESLARSANRSGPARLDSGLLRRISAQRFEAVAGALFASTGFRALAREPLADGGVDVWLEPQGAADGQASLLRCRQRTGRSVSIEDIRELELAMASRGARSGHFATTSLLTPDAIAFARSRGIQLLDVDGILRMAAKLAADDRQALLAVATEDDPAADIGRAVENDRDDRAVETAQAVKPGVTPAARATVVQLPERFRASRAA